MRISAIRLINYKSFPDSGWIHLTPGFNIIIGKNNSGKTAILEAFTLRNLRSKPHRGTSIPRGVLPATSSIVECRTLINGEELKTAVLNKNNRTIFMLPKNHAHVLSEYADHLFNKTDIEVEFKVSDGSFSAKPLDRDIDLSQDKFDYMVITPNQNRDRYDLAKISDGGENWHDAFNSIISSRIYVFNSRRYAHGTCAHSITSELKPNAENLAAAVANLTSDPVLLETFEKLIQSVFPSIHAVRSVPGGEGLEIQVWPVDPKTGRRDLTVGLDECGTGVGQVIAIIYVILTIKSGVIVIDEPNSFLHPGAIKKLLHIMKSYPNHQYVITTHAVEILSNLRESNVFEATICDGISKISHIARKDLDTLRNVVEELGVSASDLFSSERVIWAEGPTEKRCFDAICETLRQHFPFSFDILSLHATGDFHGKRGVRPQLVVEIYSKLSQGSKILPVSVAFCFDREDKTEIQRRDMARQLGGTIHFLPRRMIENYFLDANAIAALLRERVNQPIDISSTLSLIETKMNGENISETNGAKVLDEVIEHLTDGRYKYRKVQDGEFLVRYMLKESPESISDLIFFINSVI